MNKLKLMTVLGTRPEIIRLSAVIRCADRYFDHIVVHTGQNYAPELSDVFFRDLKLRAPDYSLGAVGADLGETMGAIIAKSYQVMQKEKPDAVLILGDTNSALAAISAKRLKIPIFHMEAGNRCWDWNVSEMINRKIVDHISDINLPYTENSRRYLLSEGIDGKTIFVTGSPMREVLERAMPDIEQSDVLARLGLEKGRYIVVSAHREENIDLEANFLSLMNAINQMAETYQVPVIYSTHPRSMKFIEQRQFKFHPLVRNLKPLGFLDYNQLQMNSLMVLSDSGTLSEESAMLGFCGVLIRTSTERPEVLDKGTVVVGGITEKSVLQSAELALAMQRNGEPRALPPDYADTNVSVKVIKIIQSYTPIVNETVWLKNPLSTPNNDVLS
jgi:UDP-N-acetylglucosamine 2-epimerase